MKKSFVLFSTVLALFLAAPVQAAVSKFRGVRCYLRMASGCTPEERSVGKKYVLGAAATAGGLAILAAATGVSVAALKKEISADSADGGGYRKPVMDKYSGAEIVLPKPSQDVKNEAINAFINLYEKYMNTPATDKAVTLKLMNNMYQSILKSFPTGTGEGVIQNKIADAYRIKTKKDLDREIFLSFSL